MPRDYSLGRTQAAAPYDPKRDLLEKLGDISKVEIAQNEVVLAIYMRPEKAPGSSIVLPQQNLREDQFQGKCGLVVKIGSACRFVRKDERTGVEYGLDINLHDWVIVRASDTWPFDLCGTGKTFDPQAFVKCRLVYDDQIRLRVTDPLMVW